MLTYKTYTKNRLAIKGDRKKYYPALKSIGARWNPKMVGGEGWVISCNRETQLKELISNLKKDEKYEKLTNNKKNKSKRSKYHREGSDSDEDSDIEIDPVVRALLDQRIKSRVDSLQEKEQEEEEEQEGEEEKEQEEEEQEEEQEEEEQEEEEEEQEEEEEEEEQEGEEQEEEEQEEEEEEQEKKEDPVVRDLLDQSSHVASFQNLDNDEDPEEHKTSGMINQDEDNGILLVQDSVSKFNSPSSHERVEVTYTKKKRHKKKLSRVDKEEQRRAKRALKKEIRRKEKEKAMHRAQEKERRVVRKERDSHHRVSKRDSHRKEKMLRERNSNKKKEKTRHRDSHDPLQYYRDFRKKPSDFRKLHVSSPTIYSSSASESSSSDDFPSPNTPHSSRDQEKMFKKMRDLQRRLYETEIENHKLRAQRRRRKHN